MEREREHMHTILTGGRGRRRGLALAISTAALAIGLMGISASSASAVTCTGASAITVNSYSIVGPTGNRTATTMNGNVHQNDTVTANFTVSTGCPNGVVVNFPSYLAPGPTWDPTTANQQTVFNPGDGTFTTGLTYAPGARAIHTSTPISPTCFQIDLVVGDIIQTFSPPGGTYGAQGRLVDHGNGDPGCTPAF
jgi:hypothetical protein